MKLLKKISALLVAVVMMAVTVVPALAADITVNWPNTEKDTQRDLYAYQIFKGTIANPADPHDSILADIQWGAAFSSGAVQLKFISGLNEIITDESKKLGDNASAVDVAEAISDLNTTDANNAPKIAQKAYNALITTYSDKTARKSLGTILPGSVQDNGFYLILDETDTLKPGESFNPAVLQVMGNTTITPKTEKVKVEKTVKDGENGLNNGEYGEKADYSVGDKVPFRLVSSKVPDLTNYKNYKYIFHDTLSDGLTFNNDIKVYVVGEKKNVDNTVGANLDEISSATEVREFSANANAAEDGLPTEITVGMYFKTNNENINTIPDAEGKYIVVEYTATLNSKAEFREDNTVYLEYSNNPNDENDKDTDNTPEDKVYVFNFTLEGLKRDGESEDHHSLAGATFAIVRNQVIDKVTKKQYAEIENGKVQVWKDVPENNVQAIPESGKVTTLEDGKINISGLDAGEYELYELKAPDGYNTPSIDNPFILTITPTYTNSDTVNGLKYSLVAKNDQGDKNKTQTGDEKNSNLVILSSGTVKPNIDNYKGTTLPETGGMGTTMLYVAGGILLIGSAVLLVTKKRMGHEN